MASDIDAKTRAILADLVQAAITPVLSVVYRGEHGDAASYRRVIEHRATRLGIICTVIPMPGDASVSQVVAVLEQLNTDPCVHGVLMQTPLTPELRAAVAETLRYDRDVEGITPGNLGRVMLGSTDVFPCTAASALAIIEHQVGNVRGKRVVIANNSATIGRPLAQMLLQRRATVTVTNTGTVDLASETRRAEVLVTAIGKPRFFGLEHIAEGAVVVDVGINELPDGLGICGDVDTDAVLDRVAAITPVPGGVGPVTTAMLLYNTVALAAMQVRGRGAR